MAHADDLPLLEWDTLNLGKTVSKVRGAWEVLTESGEPEWRRVGEAAYALLGGRDGFTLGLAAAYDLAARLARRDARPWDEGDEKVDSRRFRTAASPLAHPP